MSPVYLNPPPSPFPVVELKEEQHLQLFLPPNQAAAVALSGPAFFNTAQDHQRVITELGDDHKVNNYITGHAGSSDHRRVHSSSSLQQPMVDDSYCTAKHKISLCKREDGSKMSLCKREDGSESSRTDNGSAKWTSSKMRLMQKMISSNCSTNAGLMKKQEAALEITQKVQYHDDHQLNHKSEITSFNTTTNTRVCTDCYTTTTPLWRSGPRGPKSLCNACGIRQRKARQAMEAAGNRTVVATNTPSMKINKVQNKEKKLRTNVHVSAQYKKQFKSQADNEDIPPHNQKKLYFKDFALSLSKNSAFGRVFPQDEEEAAILLMELSCGAFSTVE